MANGVLYFAAPDHAYAIDARTAGPSALLLAHARGIHIGNRGVGIYGNYLFSKRPTATSCRSTPRQARRRWHKEIADVRQQYFCTPAIVIGGMSSSHRRRSLDVQGYLGIA